MTPRALLQSWEGIVMAWHSMRANKLRSLLTTLGIVIGVSTITTIFTIIGGVNRVFSEQIAGLGSDNLYIQKLPWAAGMDYFKYRNRKDIDLQEYEAVVRNASLTEYLAPVVTTNGTVSYATQTVRQVSINGTNEQYKDVANIYPETGRFLSALEVENRRNVCVLGTDVAEKLFYNTDPIGRKIFVRGSPFYVIGILEKQGEILGQNLDTVVLMPVGTFLKTFGSRRSITIRAKVAESVDIETAKDELRGILRRVRRVAPDADDDFAINQQDMIVQLYNNLTSGLYAFAIGIGAISLLVGGIGIMNIMLVSVTERTTEIGIRKAIGATRKDILWQFLIEAVSLCLLGGILGVALGFALGAFIDSVSPVPSTVSLQSVIVGFAFASSVGIFFGLYPAGKAARLHPIQALQKK